MVGCAFSLCATRHGAVPRLVPSLPLPVPRRVAGAAPGAGCYGRSCVAEPRINASEDVVLHVAGVAVTLQCNLTSSPSPLAASYWVKNGEEIPGTRKPSNTTEYK